MIPFFTWIRHGVETSKNPKEPQGHQCFFTALRFLLVLRHPANEWTSWGKGSLSTISCQVFFFDILQNGGWCFRISEPSLVLTKFWRFQVALNGISKKNFTGRISERSFFQLQPGRLKILKSPRGLPHIHHRWGTFCVVMFWTALLLQNVE